MNCLSGFYDNTPWTKVKEGRVTLAQSSRVQATMAREPESACHIASAVRKAVWLALSFLGNPRPQPEE